MKKRRIFTYIFEQFLYIKMLCGSYLYLQFVFVKFLCRKEIGKKAERKMLVKLTTNSFVDLTRTQNVNHTVFPILFFLNTFFRTQF